VLKHLMSAGKRALGASIVLGCVLVFAVGGPQSPDANQMIKVAIFSFFGFWIVFAFFFRPARPRGDAASNFIDAPGSLAHTDHWLRGDTHSDGLHHSGSDGGASHGGSGDGGGHTGH
jgi:hypothetical protein